MIRQFFLVILFFALANTAIAQDQLTGRVYENKTNVFLQGVRVENLKSHVMTITGPDGSFAIKAATGDIVCFTNSNYKPDTVYLPGIKYIQVFMEPRVNMLQEVKVTNQQIKSNAGFNAQPEKGVLGSNSVLYQKDENGNYKGGIKISIPDGQVTPKQHETRVAADEKEKEGVRKVFNAENLKKYLPISGQELDNFIILYIPDLSTFYSHAFNLVGYLNGCFEEFNKIPLDERQSKALTQLVKKE